MSVRAVVSKLVLSLPAAALALGGVTCGGGGGTPLPTGPTPVVANVEFVLTTAPTSNGADANAASPCFGLVRLRPGWWSYSHVTMVTTEPDHFGLFFDQVPIGRQSVRLTVPEGCASTDLTANGISLTAEENGTFAFTVDSDGRITP